MKKLTYVLIVALMMSLNAYADGPQNVVYNNGPQGGDSGAGVAMERLRATEKELDRMTFERNVAVKEMNFRIERDENRTSVVWYIVGGLVAGAAAGYLGGKAVSK